MANTNTVYQMQKPAQLSNISTTFTLFKRSADTTLPVTVYIPGSARMNGKAFRVRASGTVTTATTTNVTVTLQYGTSATTSSNTTIEASTAVAVNTASSNWIIEATVNVDDTSGEMNGFGWSQVDTTKAAETTLDNVPTSVDTDAEGNGFVVGITFSSGDADNVADLKDFTVEVL